MAGICDRLAMRISSHECAALLAPGRVRSDGRIDADDFEEVKMQSR
jgi:hypothetical protein